MAEYKTQNTYFANNVNYFADEFESSIILPMESIPHRYDLVQTKQRRARANSTASSYALRSLAKGRCPLDPCSLPSVAAPFKKTYSAGIVKYG